MPYGPSPAATICSSVRESRDITLSDVAHNESLNYSPLHGILYLNVDAINDSSFLLSLFFLKKYTLVFK